MSTILLKAAVEIAASNSFESVFENLRKHLISLEVCKEVTFFVCRFNGDSCYPQKNCRLEKASLKTLQNIQPETVAEQEGELQSLKTLGIGNERRHSFAVRYRVLDYGGEVFVFFDKGEAYNENTLINLLKLSYSPLNLITADGTLDLILKYAAFVAEQKEPEMMLVSLADMAREFSAADRATIWMGDKAKKTLWTKVAHGIPNVAIPDTTGVAGYAYHEDETVISNNPYSDPRFNAAVDRKTGYRTKSIIALPIKNSENIVIGALQCVNKLSTDSEFNDNDVAKLNLVSTYVANTLELASLHKEIEDTQKEVIFTMGEVGEFRSKETGNHVKRVAEYSYIIAVGYGLSVADAELLRMASPMHDIGKVAIADSIL
ncbi:MAG TPA: GAF domain-containing protein, partial [Campylobacterales bacterium]|nr:GAF domain-containing protein [Campylobacterales bacterium]